jgi:exonuclease V gamma subunit
MQPIGDVEDLIGILSEPAKAFLHHRLGLRLERDGDAVPDDAVVEPDNRTAWAIRDAVVRARWSGVATRPAAAWSADGVVGPGALGALAWRPCAAAADGVVAAVRGAGGDGAVVCVTAGLADGRRLTAQVPELRAGQRIAGDVRKLTLGMKHHLGWWLRHLVCQVVAPGSLRVHGLESTLDLPPVAAAGVILMDLLDLAQDCRVQALPLQPEIAWALVQDQPPPAVDPAWSPATALVWRDRDPWPTPEARGLAQRLWAGYTFPAPTKKRRR